MALIYKQRKMIKPPIEWLREVCTARSIILNNSGKLANFRPKSLHGQVKFTLASQTFCLIKLLIKLLCACATITCACNS